ncbi:protein ubiquitination [Trichomonas vaginalis G3]|uniref:protein ubiquitination n=1 Tax=Trichomonas vaginalis (strain ATCC PRA-98 / G3) TaxID=412133 RepID=UPI0021E5FDC4|nr:protein ubiquitination [Trichomonas vaginalis G3]KAI5527685.1 protein ubiquitination [Trichomonas vaginalis G3]
MSDVPLPECLPKPEEPKEPQQSPQQPQFQQVPPNYYQFPPQGYYPPQGFPNYPPQPMPYFPNPWLFQQAPPQQFKSQSKRDQEFEEGLNRLRKDYATAPMEDDRLSVSSLRECGRIYEKVTVEKVTLNLKFPNTIF